MNPKKLKETVRNWQKSQSKLIVLTGPRKAGKDKLRLYLKRNYPGLSDFRIAQPIVKIAKILELEPERRVFHALFGVNKLLYPILGGSAYVRVLGRQLDRQKPEVAIVQAARTEEEYREFILKRGGILIGITAGPRVRYSRAVADMTNPEKRDEGQMSFKNFMGDPRKETGEYSPIEREIASLVRKAHFIIENNYKTPQKFYRKVDEVMKILGIPKRSYQNT